MDRTERFYLIDKLLQTRQSTSMQVLMSELEVSRSTIKRDMIYMRDRLEAPIIWDAYLQGYRYKDPDPGFPKFSLPGLWFNSSELHALLTMEHLLEKLQPNFLTWHISPLRHRVRKVLEMGDHSVEELVRRVRIIPGSSPPANSAIFQKVTDALLRRVQIVACYQKREAKESELRTISPQRLVYYDEKWYLDAWCHSREGLRTFRLSNMTSVDVIDTQAVDVDEPTLDNELTAGYGIFGGSSTRQAVLRFGTEISKWIIHEMWHSEQTTKLDEHGRLILSFPYSNDLELMMKILGYGSDVEVLEPQDLRQKVADKIHQAGVIYQ